MSILTTRGDFDVSVEARLTFKQKIQLAVRNYAKIGKYRNRVTGQTNDLYVSRCPIHGLFADYSHGLEYELRCQKCEEKFITA